MVHILVPPSARQPTDWEMSVNALKDAREQFAGLFRLDEQRIRGELAGKTRSLFYDIRRVGDGACVFYVSRSDPPAPKPRQVAVTALLGGFDEEDDAEALELSGRALWAIADHVFDAPSLERAATGPRPLQLSSFRSVDEYEDDMIRVCVAAITEAFFNQFDSPAQADA